MNIATTFTDLSHALRKFIVEPLCADLFAWCELTGTDTRLRSRMTMLSVPFSATTAVSDLKARLERRIVSERGRRERGHWSFDANRLIALKQMLATVEKFQAASSLIDAREPRS